MNNSKTAKILGIISIPVMYTIFFLAMKYIKYLKFSYDLVLFVSIVIIFVSLHFFFNIKKMYNWMFDHRIIIGIAVFAFLVIGGYNGSSLSFWNNYVDPKVEVKDSLPVIGIARGIRSDQWMVSMPTNLSQATKNVNFNKINGLMNAKDNDVSLYPRLVVKNYSMAIFPGNWGFLFLPLKNAFSFYWYSGYIPAFLIAIELFMILTKKNKLYSTLGAFLTVIAPAVLWWDNCLFMLYGGAALLLINKFMNTDNKKIRIILAAALGYVATNYIFIMYPAWMIPYAYFFFIFFIWLIIENKKNLKWSDLLYLIITAIVCAITFIPVYLDGKEVFNIVSQTVYPGNRLWYGGGNRRLLFTYVSQIFFPYISIGNPCEYSQYISLFPIPLFMAIYYLIKNKLANKKIDWFLLMTTIFSVILTIWCWFPLPKIISKLFLLTMSTGDRAQLVIGFTSIFMLIYMMSRYETKKENKVNLTDKILKILVSSLITVVILWLSTSVINAVFPNCIRIKMNVVAFIIFLPIFYFTLKNSKKTNKVLTILLLFVTFISCILIMPITKGLSIMYEKPFAKEIQKLVKENKDAKFMAVADGSILSNYILAQGAKTITSTNYVPNLELWHKLDTDKKYNEVYNRYAHVHVMLTTKETNFELLQADNIKINLNYEDICKTEANYLVSKNKLELEDDYYKLIYDKNDMFIYKTTCK